MARKKISQLPLDNAVIGTDVVPIVSDGATKRVQLSTLGTYFSSVGFSLPVATANTLGGVKAGGSGITIDGSGVISATVSSLDWASITGKPSTFPPTLPTGTAGDVLTYVDGAWTAAAPTGGVSSWNDLTDKPSTFAPSAHAASHYLGGSDVIAVDGAQVELRVAQNNQPTSLGAGTEAGAFLHRLNLNGLADAVSNAVDQISYTYLSDLPTLGTAAAEDASAFAPASHQHTLADISDAGTAAGSDVGDFAAAAHAHAWSDITSGVPSTFAPSAHKSSHATGGSDALSPSDIGAADAAHNHAASAITSGTLDISRIPTGTSSTTVCIGNDARLSDTRTPTAGSVTDSSITSGGLSASSINWVAIQPWAANTAYQKGDLVSNAGIAYRRSAAGTSGATFNTANWQQITPGEFSASQITSGVFATARLASSGTASSTTFLRGDGAWAAAGSTNASDLNQGTLANARMTTRARASMNLFLWSSFR